LFEFARHTGLLVFRAYRASIFVLLIFLACTRDALYALVVILQAAVKSQKLAALPGTLVHVQTHSMFP
jgi:hypothetical protein